MKEYFEALTVMHSNKSPGNDGLSKEFYLAFFQTLGSDLMQCLNYSFQEGEKSFSQKQAVMTLIEKKDRDNRYIKNWRPISLLNVDAKILSKVLATRIKRVIHKLVSNEQSAYVPGGHITDAIRSVSDLLYYADQNNLDGYLVSVDMEKAFDSVDHTFIISTSRKYGFGPNFIQWIKVLLSKQVSRVINNGFTTGYFTIER